MTLAGILPTNVRLVTVPEVLLLGNPCKARNLSLELRLHAVGNGSRPTSPRHLPAKVSLPMHLGTTISEVLCTRLADEDLSCAHKLLAEQQSRQRDGTALL